MFSFTYLEMDVITGTVHPQLFPVNETIFGRVTNTRTNTQVILERARQVPRLTSEVLGEGRRNVTKSKPAFNH